MRRNCRTVPDEIRVQAEATAASIIAQGRSTAAREAQIAEEEPMNRYINPIPTPCRPAVCPAVDQSTQDRILETLCCQNQLLLDLLSAVNALTAAMLNRRGGGEGGGCDNS